MNNKSKANQTLNKNNQLSRSQENFDFKWKKELKEKELEEVFLSCSNKDNNKLYCSKNK
jgi:hypothetical protein